MGILVLAFLCSHEMRLGLLILCCESLILFRQHYDALLKVLLHLIPLIGVYVELLLLLGVIHSGKISKLVDRVNLLSLEHLLR